MEGHQMNPFRRQKHDPLPQKFDVLACYNTEKAHGLVHTDAWVEQMVGLQAEFVLWIRETYDSWEDNK